MVEEAMDTTDPPAILYRPDSPDSLSPASERSDGMPIQSVRLPE